MTCKCWAGCLFAKRWALDVASRPESIAPGLLAGSALSGTTAAQPGCPHCLQVMSVRSHTIWTWHRTNFCSLRRANFH